MMARSMLLVLLAALMLKLARSASLVVGGNGGWTLGPRYDPISARVGDTLVFDYAKGQHNVVELNADSCNGVSSAKELAGLAAGPYSYTIQTAGTFYFACSVPGHCDAGMLLVVQVQGNGANAPAIAPATATTASSPSSSASAGPEESTTGQDGGLTEEVEQHPGYCDPPIPDPTLPGYEVASCYGPGIPMAPGSVVNWFYVLPNPYPIGQEVAVVKQSSRVVDGDGRDVPLSEIYMHHFFGNVNLLKAEGAELRGTITEDPLPLPYYVQVNGSALQTDMLRAVNVHMINTLGVQEDDLLPCIECWCRDQADIQGGYAGGTACCTPLNCPTTADPAANHTYYLEYNVTYRTAPQPYQAQNALHPYLIDVVNGSIEHDIHRGLPGSSANVSLKGALDSRCPQASPFGVARCTAHQHIGGQCIELRFLNGSTICKSCPTYGSSPSVDDPGNEHGYVVKIEPAEVTPPLMLEPGTLVELLSTYDSSTDHFGVMSLFFMDLAEWDPSCPGPQAAEVAFGPRMDEDFGDTFGLFEGKGISVI